MKIAVTSRAWFVGLAFAAFACSSAHANSLGATYYAISSSDPSYNTLCCGTYSNEVLSTLGPDGLPILDPGYSGAFPNAADLHNTLSGQEIT